MRLPPEQLQAIHQLAQQVAGDGALLRVIGSRLDDSARVGDLDLMLEMQKAVENPALLAAMLSAKVTRALQERKVDVLISAPNLLRLPIHDIVFQEGFLI